MTWKETDLRKFINWSRTFVSEEDGQGSSKRIQAVVWAVALWKVLFITLDMVAAKTLTVWGAIGLDLTVFGFIAVMLGLATYADLKSITDLKDNTQK